MLNHLKKPTAQSVSVGTVQPLGTYEALAKELNFFPAQLLETQLRRFLAEQQIQVYSYEEVNVYLARIAEKEGKMWIWRPLREQDKLDYEWGGWYCEKAREVIQRGGHGSYQSDSRPYDKAVPIHILRQVKTIQDKFGDKVSFFVSDYAVPKPDPFIMVMAADTERFIFGVWDEPGFGTDE